MKRTPLIKQILFVSVVLCLLVGILFTMTGCTEQDVLDFLEDLKNQFQQSPPQEEPPVVEPPDNGNNPDDGKDDPVEPPVDDPPIEDIPAELELEIHFIDLKSYYTGDSIFIQAGNIDILIDAGPDTKSIQTIYEYVAGHMEDDLLDYVIVTHAHEDHYAGFATYSDKQSLFDMFNIGTIIDFAKTNKSSTAVMQKNYLREREEAIKRGAQHYTAQECLSINNGVFQLTDTVSMTILNSYYYTHSASSENDYSVCTLFSQGDNHYLFTGDLEAKGEEYLTQLNDLPQVKLFKGGHHGSNTSNTEALLSVIRPEIVVFTCTAFSSEYTTNNNNTFPTQDVINRVSKYTEYVYVTTVYDPTRGDKGFAPLNGDIVIGDYRGDVLVTCSAFQGVLKDSSYFSSYRVTPNAWK